MGKEIEFIAIDATWIEDRLIQKNMTYICQNTKEEKATERAMALGSVKVFDDFEKTKLQINATGGKALDLSKPVDQKALTLITGIGATTIPKLKNIGINNQTDLEKAIKDEKPELKSILKAQYSTVKSFFGLDDEIIEDDEDDIDDEDLEDDEIEDDDDLEDEIK